jgi:CRISPR system Cascade subunit CasE
MYLSRLILNPRDRRVRGDLSNCHQLHQRLLAAFPNLDDDVENAREVFGILHRVETDPDSGVPRVLVQSRKAPDWSALPADYLLANDPFTDDENPSCKDIGGAWDQISDGRELIFRLRANPTKRIDKRRADPMAGKRVELQTEAEWLGWLQRHAERSGFEVLTVNASASSGIPDWSDRQTRARERYGMDVEVGEEQRGPIADTRANPGLKLNGRKENANGSLTFGSVLFEGRLRVTDAEVFRLTLERGIGSGKAYGFGLLSVAPGQ